MSGYCTALMQQLLFALLFSSTVFSSLFSPSLTHPLRFGGDDGTYYVARNESNLVSRHIAQPRSQVPFLHFTSSSTDCFVQRQLWLKLLPLTVNMFAPQQSVFSVIEFSCCKELTLCSALIFCTFGVCVL